MATKQRNSMLTLAVLGLAAGPVLANTYSTGFEDPPFTTGSINGQDGWSATNPNINQSVVNTVAHTGSQSWHEANTYTTGSFGDQPFSAPLPGGEKVGEATSVGATPGATTGTFSVWFKAGSTTADNSFASLSLTDAGGSRMNYVGISYDGTNGLNLFAYDATYTAGSHADFNESGLATNLDASVWHQITVETKFNAGANNDVVNYYVDGALKQSIGSWEEYYRHDVEQAGNLNQVFASDRVLFRSSGTAAPGAAGFYFDDFSVSDAAAVPLPSSALGGMALLGGLGLVGAMKRGRRQTA